MPNACTRPSLYVWVRVCAGALLVPAQTVCEVTPTYLPTYLQPALERYLPYER